MKVQKKSKEKRRKNELDPIRSKTGAKILKLLAKGVPQSEITKKCPFSKTRVNYWVKKFLEKKIIRVKISGKPKFYELTPFGAKILTRSEVELYPFVVMEDYAVKFQLIRDSNILDWVKLGEPKNWVKLGITIGDCRVEKTTKSIIVHTGRLQGFNPSNLLVEAGQLIGLVKDFLEQKGVQICCGGVPLHEPIFRFYTSEAEVLTESGTFYDGSGSLDCSDGVPHVEWSFQTAKNYLEMPNRVKRIEENQIILFDSMMTFSRGMEEHMKLIKALQYASLESRDSALALKKVVVEFRDTIKEFISFISKNQL